MTLNRKQELLTLLKQSKEAINGQSLAEHFGVTRQIIVQDIALLRADGSQIISTNRGYIYKASDDNSYAHRLFKVNHTVNNMEEELLAIVDNGGRIQYNLNLVDYQLQQDDSEHRWLIQIVVESHLTLLVLKNV